MPKPEGESIDALHAHRAALDAAMVEARSTERCPVEIRRREVAARLAARPDDGELLKAFARIETERESIVAARREQVAALEARLSAIEVAIEAAERARALAVSGPARYAVVRAKESLLPKQTRFDVAAAELLDALYDLQLAHQQVHDRAIDAAVQWKRDESERDDWLASQRPLTTGTHRWAAEAVGPVVRRLVSTFGADELRPWVVLPAFPPAGGGSMVDAGIVASLELRERLEVRT